MEKIQKGYKRLDEIQCFAVATGTTIINMAIQINQTKLEIKYGI